MHLQVERAKHLDEPLGHPSHPPHLSRPAELRPGSLRGTGLGERLAQAVGHPDRLAVQCDRAPYLDWRGAKETSKARGALSAQRSGFSGIARRWVRFSARRFQSFLVVVDEQALISAKA